MNALCSNESHCDQLRLAIVLTAALLLSGCGDDSENVEDSDPASQSTETVVISETDSAIRFAEATDQSGIHFVYRNGQDAGVHSIVESLGGGVGLLDFDADGDADVVIPGGGHFPEAMSVAGDPTGLFRNEGGLRFTDVSTSAGVSQSRYYTHGIAITDFDNDGCTDFLATGYGGLQLFHNMGDGTFEELGQPAGLTDTLWSSSAAFADFNGDGNADLYVVHYVDWSLEKDPFCQGPEADLQEVCPPRNFEPLPDTLYLSQGDGTFIDASQEWGLRPDGKGLGVVVGDVDLDGHVDVYVGNDTVANFLYRNTGSRFEDAGLQSGTALNDQGGADGSMGVDLGDFNGDGLPDLWVANFESESFALYRNQGDCFFQPVSSRMGITSVGALFVGWGTVFLDADNDRDLDIFVANGHVVRYPRAAPLRQHPLVFENHSGQSFTNIAPAAGKYTSTPHMGRGVASSDLDNDGDPDLIVSHTNEPVSVLKNQSNSTGQWIRLRLIGRASSRHPVGAIVQIDVKDGVTLTRQIRSGGSYASSSDDRLLIGLGNAERIESLTIRWPSGRVQQIKRPAVGTTHTIIESAE